MDNSLPSSPSHERSPNYGTSQLQMNGAGPRRPQTLMSPIEQKFIVPTQTLTLTIHKDNNGYGMKVSGDNPVFVESVKAGGAAQKAGLIAGDMILKVNGTPVQYSTHTNVVQLIKSSATVELTVSRSHKMQRPSSVSMGPSTPLAQQRITAPLPVDQHKRREMEHSKKQTLRLMLEQEKKNLDTLMANNGNNRQDVTRAETNIKKLQEQLRQVCGEDLASFNLLTNPTINPVIQQHHQQQQQQQSPPPHQSTPAFLSRFPRSLSSLSLGTRKKSADKDPILSPNSDFLTMTSSSSSTTTTPLTTNSPILNSGLLPIPPPTSKKKFGNNSDRNSANKNDIPPPLPQRNVPRKSMERHLESPVEISAAVIRRNTQISDLDNHSTLNNPNINSGKLTPTHNYHHHLHHHNNSNINNNNNINPSVSPVSIPTSTQQQQQQQSKSTPTTTTTPSSGKGKKQKKAKMKALSDPKMSSQMFIQMESGGSNVGGNVGVGGVSQYSHHHHLSPHHHSHLLHHQQKNNQEPPPLPPRQPGLMDENKINNNGNSNSGGGIGIGGSVGGSTTSINSGRPLPNSIETVLNYPLIATCTAVRDNLSAFPLSHRPNIVQHLQQQQQMQQQQHQNLHHQQQLSNNFQQHHLHQHHHHQNLLSSTANKSTALGLTPQQLHQISAGKHRRVVSSPEHIHPTKESSDHGERMHKSTSGSWELLEKDNEITPPGTPPPPYLSPSSGTNTIMMMSGGPDDNNVTDSSQFDLQQQQQQRLGSPIISASQQQQPTATFQGGAQISAAQANIIQKPIISMEDDEISDQECFIEEHGPFRSLSQLLEQENLAHLAVFLNFVLSNSDPAPLLFYLITGIYKEGTVKDMRKWAYEIHSTFLVPRAPLLWSNVDESLAREIDDILQREYDKGEFLRKIFWKSRLKAKDFINTQLQEFQIKRTAGLGTMYGPSDQQLLEAKGDKTKEQLIVEQTILPKLQQFVDDLEKEAPNECPKKSALCSALSTVLHRIFVTRSNPNSPIDKVHHFVSREKSFKSRLMGKNRKAQVRGHHLVLRQYYEVTHCNHCQNIIWGVSPQGYHCTDCELNIHRACSRVLEENCPGPAPTKRKEQHNDNKFSKFIEIIRPTHHFTQMERSRRQDEENGTEDTFCMDRPLTTSVTRQPSDRRPDHHHHNSAGSSHLFSTSSSSSTGGGGGGGGGGSGGNAGGGGTGTSGGSARTNIFNAGGVSTDLAATAHFLDTDANTQDTEHVNKDSSKSKSAPVSVNRSESYKERLSHKRNRNNRRKTSDPSLSNTNDEQVELGLANATFTASCSSSSLSSNSLDNSHSISLETVGAPTAGTGTVQAPRQCIESDDEGAGEFECDWSSNVAADILQALSDAEKKRQEVINEIYQTERNHVRTLRLLEGIFMRPLQEHGVLNNDHLQLLFPPALITLKDLHSSFEVQLKQRRMDHGPLVGDIGDLLLTMFDGKLGEELKDNAAQFCARQQIALEALKEKRRKDENLQRLLTKAESHKACRRLQLKDLLPTALQRLTKYPLLFESLYKITIRVSPDNETEADAIKKALDNSRNILNHVNQAVRVAEDAHKLHTIQKKLDKSGFDKEPNSEYKNLDLTQHKLIHDGLLIMKKNPGTQLHGLLFEDIMVLLQKQDDRYLLKNHTNPGAGGGESKSIEGRFNPITKVNLILVRQSAVDKNTFFLINTNVSQMLELSAPSSSECKAWFKHISDAADAYKARTKGNHDLNEDTTSTTSSITTATTTAASVTPKDSFDGTPERTEASMLGGEAINQLQQKQKQQTTISNNNNNNNVDSQNKEGKDDGSNNNNNNNNSIDHRRQDNVKNNQRRKPHHHDRGDHLDDNEEEEDEEDDDGDDDDEEEDNDDESDNDDDNDNLKGKHNGYSNSNNTRTLTQQCSLVAPSEVQITVSPALTAEPVLTPSERLRRLDESIRLTLAEKQQIVCDMFRVPNEHFAAIADIAGQPEAPKPLPFQEPSDLILAAFAQVQSLTETLNDYIKVTTHQEISAVSQSLCDECHKNQMNTMMTSGRSSVKNNNSTSTTSSSTAVTTVRHGILERSSPVVEDEDGYCEIDELQLAQKQEKSSQNNSTIPIDEKRQSTNSTDSIPEETELEINSEALDDAKSIEKTVTDLTINKSIDEQSQHHHIEVNDQYDSTTSQLSALNLEQDNNKLQINSELLINEAPFGSNSSCSNSSIGGGNGSGVCVGVAELCGPNRLLHATSLAPAVPCHLIASYVTALSAHVSQLLPKLNERDNERELLRRENQYLREMVNSMHERERVSESEETSSKAVEIDRKNSSESFD